MFSLVTIMRREEIISIFQQFEIRYWTSGKNVSKDSVNIQCPFCDDHSNHLGIFEDTGVFHCWRCDRCGPFELLLMKLTGLSDTECKKIIEAAGVHFREDTSKQIKDIFNGKEISTTCSEEKTYLPKYFEKITTETDFPLLYDWMMRRSISICTLIKHQCGVCRVGKYMNRLIVPIFFDSEIVSFQAVDLTGFSRTKYKSALSRINNYLYNYDDVGQEMIVTEGILDAWRVNENAVASFGTSLTDRQRSLILKRNLSRLVFAWDSDAYWGARREAKFFEAFVPTVEVVKLPDGEDPDSYGRKYGHESLLQLINSLSE